MSSIERIINEFKDQRKNLILNGCILFGLANDNDYSLWDGTLIGPKDTPYNKGLFILSIEFPEGYPLKAPIVYFKTPIYHLNINPKAQRSPEDIPLGYVSISTLIYWKPEYSIRELLINIYGLLYHPNPESPYGINRAKEFIENRGIYEEKVKHFTFKYANSNKIMIYKYSDRTKDWDFEL